MSLKQLALLMTLVSLFERVARFMLTFAAVLFRLSNCAFFTGSRLLVLGMAIHVMADEQNKQRLLFDRFVLPWGQMSFGLGVGFLALHRVSGSSCSPTG